MKTDERQYVYRVTYLEKEDPDWYEDEKGLWFRQKDYVVAEFHVDNLLAFDLTRMVANHEKRKEMSDIVVRMLEPLLPFWPSRKYRVDLWEGDRHVDRVGFLGRDFGSLTMEEFDDKMLRHTLDALGIERTKGEEENGED